MVNFRPLWCNMLDFGSNCSLPLLVLGDFNNVLYFDEKCNGLDVIPYEVKDLANMCINVRLTDVRSIGCFYTRTNNSMWSKIDRAMVNKDWKLVGFNSLANFLPLGCISDHSPCIVSLFGLDAGKMRPFKFFNMWTNHESFHEIVQNCWELDVMGIRQFILCKNLQRLKGELKRLNEKHFGHISKRVEMAKLALKEAQLKLQDDPHNVELQNSKSILLALIRDISEKEIKDALFPIGDDKSPGSDGYLSCFFKKSWSIIGRDFMGTIKKFFNSSSLLKKMNHAIIALIPKANHSTSLLLKSLHLDWGLSLDQLWIKLKVHLWKFIGWVMECISIPSYSIALNGRLYGFFKDKKGLRQEVHGQELEEIFELTNMSKGTMPFRYLGIPLAAKKLKISSYDSLLNKNTAYFFGWSKISLSYMGVKHPLNVGIQHYSLNSFGIFMERKACYGSNGMIKFTSIGCLTGHDTPRPV
ncbi:uncharacterized protein LOC111371966 [Olea europaea var. sylvestris]|uniref:uncharacterized protein LOC111371966 n=1 Tax=Olea europaea var. sylvestris TaxID=158386 RepID=UPI000C1CDDF1|nr:uncharacterized protein LOC111371966 [Olea europaea var. sylvestris]